MVQQFGINMQANAPMQGDPTVHQTPPPKSEPMNLEESTDYINEQLGNDFIITLAQRFKDSVNANESPTLAQKLKAML